MNLDAGSVVEDIQAKIRNVAKAALDTGNVGSVTIKLTFARNGNSHNQLKVKDQVTAQLPKVARPDSLFFATDDGALTRQNPDQPSFGDLVGGAR